MELKECMKARRSIRKFQAKSVSKEIIEKLVEMAIYAPSWKNSQVTRYYAVTNKDIIAKIVGGMPEYNVTATSTAPVLIISTVVRMRSGYNRQGEFDSSKGKGWQMYDCALSNSLFCLEAVEMGLGTVIMGIYPEELIAKELEIPETEEVISVIALGYADEEPNMPKRKDMDAILKYVD